MNEFRLLLSLRFRIRNDLGLPEDDYDRLLDAAPADGTGPGGGTGETGAQVPGDTGTAGNRVLRVVSESDS